MRSRVIIVSDNTPMLVEKMRFYFVRFMERFYLANGCRPALAGCDMLNSQLATVPRKLWGSSSGRFKLCSLVSKYLFWNTIPFDGFFKQQNSVLSCWTPNLNWASDEAWMVILVTDHPVIVAAKLKNQPAKDCCNVLFGNVLFPMFF